jgi:hypothetical protein
MGHIALHPGWAKNPKAGRFLEHAWFLRPVIRVAADLADLD